MKTMLAEWYRQYLNEFLSVEGFAAYHGLNKHFAANLLIEGKALHELGY